MFFFVQFLYTYRPPGVCVFTVGANEDVSSVPSPSDPLKVNKRWNVEKHHKP